jgi:hypothetical protein
VFIYPRITPRKFLSLSILTVSLYVLTSRYILLSPTPSCSIVCHYILHAFHRQNLSICLSSVCIAINVFFCFALVTTHTVYVYSTDCCRFSSRCDNTSLRVGVYTMTPSRIANKLRGECSYHTPIRVVLPTKKLGMYLYCQSAKAVWISIGLQMLLGNLVGLFCFNAWHIYNLKDIFDDFLRSSIIIFIIHRT